MAFSLLLLLLPTRGLSLWCKHLTPLLSPLPLSLSHLVVAVEVPPSFCHIPSAQVRIPRHNRDLGNRMRVRLTSATCKWSNRRRFNPPLRTPSPRYSTSLSREWDGEMAMALGEPRRIESSELKSESLKVINGLRFGLKLNFDLLTFERNTRKPWWRGRMRKRHMTSRLCK